MSPPYEDRNVINVAAMTAWRKQKGLNTLNQPTTRDSYVIIQSRHYHKYHILLRKYARRRILLSPFTFFRWISQPATVNAWYLPEKNSIST